MVKIGDSTELKAVSMGDVYLQAYDGKKWYKIALRNVLFVPKLKYNLFSVTTVLDKGYTQKSNADKSIFYEKDTPVLIAERSGGLFRMKFRKMNEYSLSAVSIKTWHERFAHQNVGYVRDILKRNNIEYKDDWNGYVCEGCAYGKQCRVSHSSNSSVAEKCLDIVHVDLGEMNESSLGGAKYFLIFKDDFSHFRTIYFLKKKSEAVDKLIVYLNLVENQFNRKVKILMSDNGKEIKNVRSKDVFEQLGIFHQRSAAYTPEQNGRVEREMRTIVEAARAEIYAEKLGKKLWAEALNYSVFTINQTGTSSVKGKSPADLWFGRHINPKSMKPFGCCCYVLIPDQHRQKLDKKSRKGIFVGYDTEELGYRVYIPEKNHVEVSCNVLFHEKIEPEKRYIVKFNSNANENVTKENSKNLEEETYDNNCPEELNDDKNEREDDDNYESQHRILRDRRKIKPPQRYDEYASKFSGLIGEVVNIPIDMALLDLEWKRAMQEEINSLNQMKTWKLTNLPEGRKPLTCRWVLRKKGDGKTKARLVARGFDQTYGIDYYETFAPVTRHASIRLLLSQVAKERSYLITFDVKTAFLNGELNEEIYMLQPEGFEDGSGRVCKLLKSIYGLKQAPKSWNTKLTEYLNSLNFEATDNDPCLFYNENRSIIMTIFVDDGLIIGQSKNEIKNFLSKLANKFEITWNEPKQGVLQYLGIEIKQMQNGIFISQSKYTEEILKRFGFAEVYEVSTPMEPGMITDKLINDKELKNKPYREAIGSLLYLSTMSRPDISFAVNYLSRYVCQPKVSQWKMMERIFRYLKGTVNFGIFFNGNCKLQVYTDSNYGGDDEDKCSTSGILVDYGGPIIWFAQKQKVTAISTAEAEYRAAVQGIQEVCWIRRVLFELKIEKFTKPTDLLIDNKASINMLRNVEEGKITKGKKHIEIKKKFINEHIGKTVNPIYVKSKEQLADIFTKPLSKGPFLHLRGKLLKEECWLY